MTGGSDTLEGGFWSILSAGGGTPPARTEILFVVYSDANTIVKFTLGGTNALFANTGLIFPTGLAFDSAVNLYAANRNSNTIQKFAPDGAGSVFANTGTNPEGLA